MSHRWLMVVLCVLTVLVVSGVGFALRYLQPSQYDALGSLLSAAGSVLAVIWFTGSLYYQSLQLKEQREQFSKELEELRGDARRNALTVASEILRDAEDSALKANPAMSSISELPSRHFLNLKPFNVIMKSMNPQEVRAAGFEWLKTEYPAIVLLGGIKHAAEVYFRAINRTDVDFSLDPEEFVDRYGSSLWTIPYFGKYEAVGEWLSTDMLRSKHSRKAASLAHLVASSKIVSSEPDRKEILKAVNKHREEGLPMPAIAEDVR